MKTFKEFIADSKEEERSAHKMIVILKNRPSEQSARVLLESNMQILEEGKTKEWGSGYTYRLDRRPQNQGGDQLHIYGPKGKAWAYRYNGAHSEPHKYVLPTINTIKDIVSDIFGISRCSIEEAAIVSATEDAIFLEVAFA
jgi:hypothetical protein